MQLIIRVGILDTDGGFMNIFEDELMVSLFTEDQSGLYTEFCEELEVDPELFENQVEFCKSHEEKFLQMVDEVVEGWNESDNDES